ncbi:MAG: CBS domain-containing protein [Bacteroidota bacterium]
MVVAELINYTIPTLKPTDTVEKAIEMMELANVKQLILTEDNIYRGMISLELLEYQDDEQTLLMDLIPEYENIFVKLNQHPFELIGIFQQSDTEIIAVVDNDFAFKGSIAKIDVLNSLSNQLAANELGAILEIKIKDLDYSLAEIARLVESNGTKVLSSLLNKSDSEERDNILTLKLNKQDISHTIATLERFGYEILATFASEPIKSVEKERYDMLIKYLEI